MAISSRGIGRRSDARARVATWFARREFASPRARMRRRAPSELRHRRLRVARENMHAPIITHARLRTRTSAFCRVHMLAEARVARALRAKLCKFATRFVKRHTSSARDTHTLGSDAAEPRAHIVLAMRERSVSSRVCAALSCSLRAATKVRANPKTIRTKCAMRGNHHRRRWATCAISRTFEVQSIHAACPDVACRRRARRTNWWE